MEGQELVKWHLKDRFGIDGDQLDLDPECSRILSWEGQLTPDPACSAMLAREVIEHKRWRETSYVSR